MRAAGEEHTVTAEQAEAEYTAEAVLATLRLHESGARTTEDIFTAASHWMPNGRIYGGQAVAQSLLAAQRTVPIDRVLHSMHGYFLRPGDTSQGLTLAVDRIHDGRSFATRRCQAYQNGEPIWSMIASFQDEDPGVEHAVPMPEGIPGPDELDPDDQRGPGLPKDTVARLTARPVDIRHVEAPLWTRPDDVQATRQHVWLRMGTRLGDDPHLHRAALAYMSDMTIQETVLRANGLFWGTPGLRLASLDHAMWWHRFARADEWLLYVQESPSARGGRGLSTGRMYTRDGILVASVAQEITLRVPGRS